jgi:hypothetical protein
MKKRSVVFGGNCTQWYDMVKNEGVAVALRPMGSKLFRVRLPEEVPPDLHTFLRSQAVAYVHGLYYLRLEDDILQLSLMEVLHLNYQIAFVFVEPHAETWGLTPDKLNCN